MPYLRWNTPTGAKFFELDKKDKTIIGRSKDCDIMIEDQMASRHHACVVKSGDAFYVEDMKSKNGTIVNGVPVSTWQLKESDLITIGSVQITFRIQR